MPIRGVRRPNVVPITAPSFPTPPKPHVYRKIAYTFIAFTVLIVIAVLWLSSVRAEVTIKTKKDSVKLEGTVEVAKTPASGQIPGRVVQGVFEKIQEFEVVNPNAPAVAAPAPAPVEALAAGQVYVAKGTVKVVNTYSRDQALVKTTRLLAPDGKLYRIDKDIKVPKGGSVEVGVYADKAGEEFAIGPTKFSIPGLWIDLQKFIYAESSESFKAVPSAPPANAKPATSAGLASPAAPAASGKVVSAANIEDAQKSLTDQLLEQAKKSLVAEVQDPKFTDVVYLWKVVEKKSNVTAGQSADKFLASVKLDVTAVYYAREDLMSLVRSKLKEKIPEGREFLPLTAEGVTLTLEQADAKAEVATIRANAEGTYRLTDSSPLLQKSVIAGKSKDDAIKLLKAVEGIEDIQITIKPSWMGKIPALQDKIDLKIE